MCSLFVVLKVCMGGDMIFFCIFLLLRMYTVPTYVSAVFINVFFINLID